MEAWGIPWWSQCLGLQAANESTSSSLVRELRSWKPNGMAKRKKETEAQRCGDETAPREAEVGQVGRLRESWPVFPENTQKIFKTPAHAVKLQRLKSQSSFSNF